MSTEFQRLARAIDLTCHGHEGYIIVNALFAIMRKVLESECPYSRNSLILQIIKSLSKLIVDVEAEDDLGRVHGDA
jgi:hypothetical protein